MEKVLIGTPTYDEDKHFFEEYFKALQDQKIKYDLIVADNSRNDNYAKLLQQKGILVVRIKTSADKYERVFDSRKAIINYFLQGEYTHLFWVDSDVVLPKDALKKLLAENKDIISGVYVSPFNYPRLPTIVHPVAYKLTHSEELRLPLQSSEIKQGEIKEMHSVGFGCCLIKREVLEKVPLRRIPETTSTEDILFCVDARKKGYKTFLHAGVLCKHGLKHQGRIEYIEAMRYIH